MLDRCCPSPRPRVQPVAARMPLHSAETLQSVVPPAVQSGSGNLWRGNGRRAKQRLSERRLPAGIMFAALQMYGNDDGANLYATQMHSDSGYLVTNGSVNSQRSAPPHTPQPSQHSPANAGPQPGQRGRCLFTAHFFLKSGASGLCNVVAPRTESRSGLDSRSWNRARHRMVGSSPGTTTPLLRTRRRRTPSFPR